jgi:aryl-alcohol dehydrogenase-like predicted oxidoreductase
MNIDPKGMDWHELALRFVLSIDGVHSCIAGTGSIQHLQHNVSLTDRGSLPEEMVMAIRSAFAEKDQNWIQQT